ncbi:MAG TPA: amidohydrolase family protein [Methylomirabilota bacterium]|nr:amidohydrolase family protein [Methylomirabilota bacterium]
MHYKRISADCHLDMIWLPPDLFTSNAPAAQKDKMPYVADSPEGPRWVARNGATFGYVGGVGSAGSKYVPGKQLRVDVMASTGLYEDGLKGIRRPGDPHLRAKEMDRDGVDAEVIYGVLAAAAKLEDHEASVTMLQIYNTWMADFLKAYPERQIGLACLPFGDIPAAIEEVHRVAKLGFRGIELSCSWNMEPMWHPQWEPLWQAIDEVNLPLHFHTFPSVSPKLREQYTGLTQRALMYSGLCLFQLALANILTALMGRAVFERYPRLRVVFGESGIGWIPYVLDRMDFEYEDQYKDLPLKMLPSQYWRRQCKATFQYDRIGTKLIDEMGAETLMWGSDYPHPDGIWPESEKYISEQFKELSPEVTRMITCENAGRFYGLIR